MQQSTVLAPPVLPVTISKAEIAQYLGCHRTTVRRRYLTDTILAGIDIDPAMYKAQVVLDPITTRKVLAHFNVEPLAWYSIVKPYLVEYKAA